MDLDGNAVNTALDYILLNFRILKAAVDPPVCVCGVVWCVVCGVWSGLHCHVPRRPDVPSLFFLPFSFFPPGNSSPVTLHCHVPRRPHLPVGWSNGFCFSSPFFSFFPPGTSPPVRIHCHVPRRPDRTVGWSNGFRLLLNYTAQCPRRYVSKNAEMLRTKKGLTSKFAWRNGFFYCFTTPTVYYFSTQKKIVY
jgi:hypothetical protein